MIERNTNIGETSTMTSNVKNPGAAVLIFNYKYRMGDPDEITDSFDESLEVDEEQFTHQVEQIVLNTVSLISVSTSKSKSSPNGSFEITLAPTKNWVNTITPGSWCAILMSQNKITPKDTKYYEPKARSDKLKMIGRIESVRVVSGVRQQDGAITTQYVVSGTDWGDLFNNNLYVDPLVRGSTNDDDPIGTAHRAIYNNALIGFKKNNKGKSTALPNSTENITAILNFLGADAPKARVDYGKKSEIVGRLAESINTFKIPKELSRYLGFTDKNEEDSPNVADIISLITGKLEAKDRGILDESGDPGAKYSEIDDGSCVIPLDSVLGTNSFWQHIVSNSNSWINEAFCELRWESEKIGGVKKPFLALYNRVKPFALRDADQITKAAKDDAKPKDIKPFVSLFRNIRTHIINPRDLITVNAGTNWRDRYNFIEVNVAYGHLGGVPENQSWTNDLKRKNQYVDKLAMSRDGFKPLIVNTKFIPKSDQGDGKLDILRLIDYKEINKEWFFNIHRMLNGSLTLVGQSEYIPVGDNILLPANAIFRQNNANKDNLLYPKKSYFLAHVESVNHSCTVSQTGARNFVTEIQFVRGIIVDQDGKEISRSALLDNDTSSMSPAEELNSKTTFGTSSGRHSDEYPADPDIQKLRGK
jgi:hypothetical protein